MARRTTNLLITRTHMKTPHINGARYYVPVAMMGRMGWAFSDADWPRGLPYALRDQVRGQLAQGIDSGVALKSPYRYDWRALQASRGVAGLRCGCGR